MKYIQVLSGKSVFTLLLEILHYPFYLKLKFILLIRGVAQAKELVMIDLESGHWKL